MKLKLTIEVLILFIIFTFLPLIWKQLIFNKNAPQYSIATDRLVQNLVYLPSQVTRSANLTDIEQETEYSWLVNGKQIKLTVVPNFGPIVEFPSDKSNFIRVYINGNSVPLSVVRDQRAVAVIKTQATQPPDSLIHPQKFNQETDGLRLISVGNISKTIGFDFLEWDFQQDKSSYALAQSASNLNIRHSFLNGFFSRFFSQQGSSYLPSVVFLIFIPALVIYLIALFLNGKFNPTGHFINMNLLLVFAIAIGIPISYFVLSILVFIGDIITGSPG